MGQNEKPRYTIQRFNWKTHDTDGSEQKASSHKSTFQLEDSCYGWVTTKSLVTHINQKTLDTDGSEQNASDTWDRTKSLEAHFNISTGRLLI